MNKEEKVELAQDIVKLAERDDNLELSINMLDQGSAHFKVMINSTAFHELESRRLHFDLSKLLPQIEFYKVITTISETLLKESKICTKILEQTTHL